MNKLKIFALLFIIAFSNFALAEPDENINCACAFGDCAGRCEFAILKKEPVVRIPLEPTCTLLPACSQTLLDFGIDKKDTKDEKLKRNESGYRDGIYNLIVNGNFELGFTAWWQYDINYGPPRFSWALQSSSQLNHEKHLPKPDGNFAALTTRNRGHLEITKNNQDHDCKAFLGLYQDFTLSDLEDCDYIKLRLSFKYFIRNHAERFVPGSIFQNGVQVFRVDVLDGFFNEIWNAFITESGDHFDNHEDEYRTFKRKFYISNAINSNQYKTMRLRFGVFETLGKLTVGLDDVKLEAKCANFPRSEEKHHEEHHEEHHGNNGSNHHEGHHEEHHHEEHHGNNGSNHHEEHHHEEHHESEEYDDQEKKRGKTIVKPK